MVGLKIMLVLLNYVLDSYQILQNLENLNN
jgi:hypothetical protein